MSDPEGILNWRRLNDRLTTSGQPSETEFEAIRATGVRHVINLGPHTNKGALDDEPGCLAALGMTYIYIPVDFENPTEDDYTQFCEALEQLPNKPVHVHCIYNARVSAFFYRYACDGRGGNKDAMFENMDGIWRPGGVWASFVGKDDDADQPNRFLGYDY